MSVQGNQVVDLRSEEVVTFVTDVTRVPGDRKTFDVPNIVAQENMVVASERPEPGVTLQTEVITGVRRQYFIFLNGVLFQEISLTMPHKHKLEVGASTVLGVLNTLDQANIALITEVFRSYDLQRDGDIEEYASEKARENNVSFDSFGLYLRPTLIWQGAEIIDEQEKWLFQLFEGSGLTPELTGDGNLSSLGYTIKRGMTEFLSEFSQSTVDSIDLPTGVTEAEISEAIRKDAERVAEQFDCPKEKYEEVKITSIRSWPDSKVRWRWTRHRVGRCKFDFWKPVTLVRDVDMVLYATATFKTADERLRIVFLDCLKEAAIAATVAAIVFTSLDAGKAIFKALFWKLLEQKLKEAVVCLIPDLKLARVPVSRWREL